MTDVLSTINAFVIAFALTLPRFLVCFSFIPIFSPKGIPRTMRAAMAVGVGAPVAIGISTNPVILSFGPADIFPLIFKELAIGLVLGILFATPFWIYQSVGALIDNQRGALSAGYMNPAAGPDASMVGELLDKAMAIVFIDLLLFVFAVEIIYQTFLAWNPAVWIPISNRSDFYILIDIFNDISVKFVLYAGPVTLVLLLIESAFAILGAYSPQLQVYFMSMPAKSLAAILILVFYLNFIELLSETEIAFYQSVLDIFNAIVVP